MSKPKADVRTLEKFKKHPVTGKRLHVGSEAVRSARCERHNRLAAFAGVMDTGWLMTCPGSVGPGGDPAHSFVVEPV